MLRENPGKKILKISNWLAIWLVMALCGLLLAACGGDAGRSLATQSNPTTAADPTTVSATTSAFATATVPATSAPAAVATTEAATTLAATTQAEKISQSLTPASTAGQSADQVESNSVVDVVKRVGPAVVTVYNKSKYPTQGRNNSGLTPPPSGFVLQGIGSGIIISSDGYIVTNNHVIDGEDDLAVSLNDGKATVPAKVVGRDKLGDIAVLKITGTVPAVAKWADRVDVGETVVAIGSALGNFRNSVSKGVVSGLNRTLPGDTASNVYIQTDASINPGNSGGPLLNLRGEIVGINTAVVRSTGTGQRGSSDIAEGLGFAIPSNLAQVLVGQIMAKGSVSRPYFGITYQMITPAEAGTLSFRGQKTPEVEGAWISRSGSSQSSIVAGGPAEKAGLKDNDVITAINGEPLNDNNPLGNVILKYKPGDTIKLTVRRGDQTLTLELTLGERPPDS